jgi:hypothetical protein
VNGEAIGTKPAKAGFVCVAFTASACGLNRTVLKFLFAQLNTHSVELNFGTISNLDSGEAIAELNTDS